MHTHLSYGGAFVSLRLGCLEVGLKLVARLPQSRHLLTVAILRLLCGGSDSGGDGDAAGGTSSHASQCTCCTRQAVERCSLSMMVMQALHLMPLSAHPVRARPLRGVPSLCTLASTHHPLFNSSRAVRTDT